MFLHRIYIPIAVPLCHVFRHVLIQVLECENHALTLFGGAREGEAEG